jgi:Raf kinase inhibitor-like YbhB/YbcL family protein
VYHIPVSVKELDEGVPPVPELPNGIRQGRNGFGEIGYGGPQPPSGIHRYFLHLYALDRDLSLAPGASRKDLDSAIHGHVLEEAQLMGRYGK